ncbi:MAG: ATP-dependent DNA helicase RecG [Aggregatilineales bacterium]
MPSALENLIKILKLERDQGYKNTAVIGGLAAYSANWSEKAHKQARRPEHHLLVDEVETLLGSYENVESKTERHTSVTYMMDRIMGRVPPPPEYQEKLDKGAYDIPTTTDDAKQPEEEKRKPPTRDEKSGSQREKSSSRNQDQRSSQQDQSKSRRKPKGGDSNASYDGDSSHQGDYDSPDNDYAYSGQKGQSGSREMVSDIPAPPRLTRVPRKSRPQMDSAEATDILRGLNADVSTVKGIGPRMASSLEKLAIETINDLLFFLPRRYDDYTQLTYISKLQPETVTTVIGTVTNTEIRIARNNRKDFYLELDDGSGVLGIMFFGQHFLVKSIRKGKQLVVSGKVSYFGNRMQMSNPEWEELDSENLHTVGIVPVYPLTEGLRARALRRLMKKTVDYWAERIPDYVPEATLDRAELGDLGWALKNLHFPEGMDHLHHARRRYAFDQLLLLQLAVMANRREWQSQPAQAIPVDDGFLESFIDAVFPYPLTSVQRRSIEDVRRDIATTTPMNRLLQGDVGSGKTAVAVTALAMAFQQGKQSAIMAPTSILAEQHYRGISETIRNMPGDRKPVVGLLTGSLTSTERDAIYSGLADGSIDIIIGTHALIQEGVEFKDLALVVIDEQHRFGVEQRGRLRGKGTNPHLLVMTATPIPRTLALTLYADLDLSVMDEMPPGRIPVQTRVIEPIARERVFSFVEAQVKEGRQAFIVYPLVEASDKIEAQSAVEAFERLSKVFFRYRVGLLHGRMKPTEKDDIMAAFANHEFDIMVTTSVAEVGVNIPNASVIVIEGANRFGLAQLHQFRGRVGRGEHKSYCLLIPDTVTVESEERLKAMEETTDGFKLAEIDWKLRGPGDLVGTRQSGRTVLQIAEAATPDLVALAQQEARTIFEEDPYLGQSEHLLLAQRVDMLFNENADVS